MKTGTARKSSGRMASKGFPNPIDVHVGARIRTRRTILGMSQTTLAENLGITFQQVQKYERGANRVSSSRMFDLARALNVQIAYFYADMSGDVSAQSPGQLDGKKPTAEVEKDPTARRETMELVRAYYAIESPKVRKNALAAIRALSGIS